MKVSKLYVTQHGLRNEAQLEGMINFVREGGLFSKGKLTEPGPLIKIIEFEDGELYVQDGHHRICAMILGGRDHLDKSEYTVDHYMYEDYTDINLKCGWVTPYDPRLKTRHSDYAHYKAAVNNYINLSDGDGAAVEMFIRASHPLYCADREVSKIVDLMKALGL